MSTFLLVHGAWLGAWCWGHVAKKLEAAGHDVRVPELPGHGADQTPVSAVTLDAYVERVAAEFPQREKPIVVGHSMGGIVLSQLAERMPERIACLIYVSAYLLPDGENITNISQLATDSLVGANMVPAADWSTIAIKPDGLKDVFAADAPEADLRRLQQLARPEPASPFNTPMRLTAERFGSVPRYYIRTAKDHAVTPMLQDAMIAKTPCLGVTTLNTSHTPFFAAPSELTSAILEHSRMQARGAEGRG